MSHAHRPFLLDLHTFPRQPGALRHVERRVETAEAWGDQLIGLPARSPVEVVCDVAAVGEGILVTGRAVCLLAGLCARCLASLERPTEVTFHELFVYADRAEHHAAAAGVGLRTRPGGAPRRPTDSGEDEDWPLTDGETIDLEDVVRDAVMLDLPWTPVCEDDCAGLCVDCGANLNCDPSHSHAGRTDARWAALASWVPSVDAGPVNPGLMK